MVMFVRELLNERMIKCYDFTIQVVAKYKELFSIGFSQECDLALYSDCIEEIRELVIQEEQLYGNLKKEDVTDFFEIIVPLTNDYSVEYMRFRNKMLFTKDKIESSKINGSDVGIDFIPQGMEFDIFPSIISMLTIRVLKTIKYKIDILTPDNDGDEEFVERLYVHFDRKLLFELCGNELSEIIGLFCDMDIAKIPDISFELLEKQVKRIFKVQNANDAMNTTLLNVAYRCMNEIIGCKNYKNRSKDVFNYLYLITKLEVIMEYMSKKYLLMLSDYCNSLNNTERCLTYATGLVKKKIKEIEG